MVWKVRFVGSSMLTPVVLTPVALTPVAPTPVAPTHVALPLLALSTLTTAAGLLLAQPASAQTAPATQTAAAEEPIDEIIVTGLRQSLRSAQSIKRSSLNIVDAIVAEDIGKLPDINVSESLARLPGVQVDRGNGEGGRIRIRGLPDLTTTYNGRDIYTAEVRNVATQDFGAGTVAALEIYKTTGADQVESGIGGLVNVRSRRAFDFDGLAVNGQLNGTYADQSGKFDVNGNLLISNRWDTGAGEFGALLNVSYTQLHYLDSARFNGGFIATARPEQSAGGSAFRFPDAVGIFYGSGKRWRPSVNAALQWRPTPELEFYADGLYQGFRREVSDRRLFVPLFGDARFTNISFSEGNQAQSLTSTGAVAPFLFQGATYEKTNTYQFAVGGAYTDEKLRVSVDVARTDTKFTQSVYSFDTFFTRAPVVNVDFDVDREDGGVEFDFVDFDTENPANYGFGGLFDRQLEATGDDWQFRTDAEYTTGMSFLPKIAAGVRLVNRNSGFDLGQDFRGPPGFTPLSRVNVDLEVFRAGFRGSDVQPTRTWISPTYESIRANIAELRTLVGFSDPQNPRPFNPNDRFRANEKSFAGYGQLTYEFTIGDVEVNGLAGVRTVLTDTSFDGGQTASYTDVLPNFSTRIRFSEALQFRAAYTQTRTRPNFNQIRPSVVDPLQGNVIRVRGGNPGLVPIQSENFDISLEYFFSPTGFVSGGLFRRNIDGFIYEQRTVEPLIPGTDLNDPNTIRVETSLPRNAGAGRLQGVELQFQTFFDFQFLPEWARSFGIQANYTYIDGEQEIPPFVPGGPTQRAEFTDVSPHTFNIIGLYERGKFSSRLAYNKRTRWFTGYDNAQAGVFSGEYTAAVSRLDFSMSYTPIENITIAADVSNILGSPFRNFRNFDSAGAVYPRDVRFEERIFSLGVRFRL